ncbi:hypothetical protein A3C87_00785 [Candidatus Kaiserbacteria bacterium RIFCSPHIGHO2_02_FULL_49_34]|uniref:HD domain-containing protein n=1 Tax=Candidatus Kaiserbacteria bacterium RIFCSPHIGHO2_02_FULL_49_34 TaxID=1798491 RepID=A0A1F6DKR2_9BACT|nr:MAG: hypothetical protein A3C87_00785 [Candidatus Kaiserbacteria bacterium RIFCSPHIGHO2_02_FULL_49_34]
MTQVMREDIPAEVREVAKKLRGAGFDAYMVGGCTRDLMLGRPPKDWDLTTNAHPDQIVALFEHSYCNNDYGTVGVVTESEDEKLKVIEVTPYRAESGYSDARRPDEVRFGVSLDEDLARRDFTVNAIALDPESLEIIDPFGGLEDLKLKRLVAVGIAQDRFAEDALRMMRAVRFAAELDFVIEADTMAAIFANAGNLKRISWERIRDEFTKMLMSQSPMQGIIFLEKLGLLPYVMPELLDSIKVDQNQAHAYDVYEHLLRSMQHAADKGWPLILRMAALLHDVGKPATRRFSEEKKDWTFYSHEVVGAKMAKVILDRMKYPKDFRDVCVTLVRWHMFFSDPDQITLSAVRRTIRNVGEEHIHDLLSLRICDRVGTGRPKEQPFRFRTYKAMVDEALRDPISVKMLKIDGLRIMTLTGEKPGPKLGHTLLALLEEVLDDPSKNTEDYLEPRAEMYMTLDMEELVKYAEAGKEKRNELEAQEKKMIRRKHKVG